MNYGLEGKRVLVTGSSKGCGRAIAKILSQEKAMVILHGSPKSEEVLRAEAQELGNAEYVTADLSTEEEINEMWKKVGEIDILINNAGIWPAAYIKDMETEDFKRTIDINLTAPFILCRKFVNQCIALGKKGKIVNVVSQAAFHGSTSGHAHYATSKGGLVTFTVSLAREVAGYGINVNAVAPGMMRTSMNQQTLEEREESYLERIPLGRIADPEEVAGVVVFLCSNQADYMTGATVDVTGGMLMR